MREAVGTDGTQSIAWTCSTCGNAYPDEFRVCPRDATPRTEQLGVGVDPLIGAVLGRTYRIKRVLGEGGMARLYEAEHLRVDARYAIKVIHDDLARDPDLLTRFEREARAAGRIRDDHVVRLFDVLRTTDGRPCLVTELLDGEDLQALLDRERSLSVAAAIAIARQLCHAVAAAHAVGVVHRDLKPANVFLCKPVSGNVPLVKVLDFGVAKLDDDEKLTRTDAVMGTAAYMAPEQARKAADAGPLADVYSIGAVIYHMLTGQAPYGNVPAVSRFALVLHEEPARPRAIAPSIPAGIEAVIQHAMARDPAARLKSPLELDDELVAFEAPAPRAQTAPASPRASGEHAIAITVRARFARPIAVFVVAASSLATGAWLAALLAIVIGAKTTSERVLIALLATSATAGVAMLQIRSLRLRWPSATAVITQTRTPARALVVGMLALGALELLVYGFAAVFHIAPLGSAARLAIASVVAVIGLGWQRWGLGQRLVRRIG
jgi:serine/threonine-protein kinase